MKRTTRHTFKRHDVLISADAVHPNLSGSGVNDFGKLFAPKREAFRGMLLEMRTRLQWSREFGAAVLGVPLATLRKWEDGTRNPCGAARKWIWLLHESLLDGPRKAYNAWDCAMWGAVDCRVGSAPPLGSQPLGVSPTVRMSSAEVHRQFEAAIAEERTQNCTEASAEQSESR